MKKRFLSFTIVLLIISTLITIVPMTVNAASIKIGDYIQMGKYYGVPILWRCVDIDENGPLVLSDKILCLKAFDAAGDNTSGSHGRSYTSYRQEDGSNYWADSNIRCWLNSRAAAGNVVWSCGNPPDARHVTGTYGAYDKEAGFLTNFNNFEIAAMKTVTQKSLISHNEYKNMSSYGSVAHHNHSNVSKIVQNYDTAYSEQVTDTMFFLDVKQINRVYQNDEQLGGNNYRIGIPTPECIAEAGRYNIPRSYFEYNGDNYWLRSPTALSGNCVRYFSGPLFVGDRYAHDGYCGVRPAFYLNTLSASFIAGNGTESNPYTLPTRAGIGENDNSVDNYIIDQVRKYTTTGESAQIDAIINSNLSGEEKFRRLNELCRNHGITDISYGVKYLSKPSPYNDDYTYLTTNENFCAYNYLDWMYNTKLGFAARSALYTSGLIFNSEVYSYMNPMMYAESDYPGAKKNKALLKKILEISEDSTVSDVLDYSNKTAKFLKNLIKLNNITVDEDGGEIDTLLNELEHCTSKAESDRLSKIAVEKISHQIKASYKGSIYLDGKNFSKALGYSASILEFVGATADDIIDIVNLNNDIETYKKYEHFLTTIYTTPDMSWEMRLAAYQLLDDINNGYWKRIQSILGNIMTLAQGFVYTDKSMISTFMEEYIGVSGDTTALFGDALATLKLATFISNIVVDTGDFVKQVAYTQGYAELGVLYANKLTEDKLAFLENQTAENAWQFFEDYTMLWNLRYQGEQQYLDMNKIKMYIFAKVPTWNYDIKKEVVGDNLARLNRAKFEMAANTVIPQSVRYVKKSVINCPVDVYVYNSDGDLIATLKDGTESDITNEYGRFAVVYQSYSGEYAKVICQSTDEELTVKMNAVNDGLVDYESADANTTKIKTFDKLPISEGNNITVQQDSYELTKNDGNKLNGSLIIKSAYEYVPAEAVVADVESVELIEGQSRLINITITPENTTNTAVDWYTLDESVATVKNGVITATGGGETTLYIKVCDSDIAIEIPVTVIPLREFRLDEYTLADNKININLSANTILDTLQTGTVAVALYAGEKLLEYHFENVAVTSEQNQTVKCIFDKPYSDNFFIRAFWWNNLREINPLCKPLSYGVQ